MSNNIHYIFISNEIIPKNKLLSSICLKTLPKSMTSIKLELTGKMCFTLNREELEECYKFNINFLNKWGFLCALPIYGKMIIECDENEYSIQNIVFNVVDDNFNIWKNVINKYQDFDFFDNRIGRMNFLRVKNCHYGISYVC